MSDNGRRTIRIGDIGQVITGKTPPTSQPELFGNDYPFITPTDIKTIDIRYLQSTERGLSKKSCELLQKYLIPKDSICYVCIGSTIGKMCMTSHDCFTNQQINSVIVNKNKFDPKYIFYLLRAITPKIKAIAGGSGAGKEIINKSSFENICLTVHDLSSQKRIGDILSTFDDLIENNTRRIAILGEMVRSLYREWFVNFRFPGHEEVKMVDSPLGPIPEGWGIKPINQLTKLISRGIAPSYDNNSNSLVINQKCIRNNRITLFYARKHSTNVPLEKKLVFGDVLINSTGIGTLGRVTQVYTKMQDCTVDTHVTIVRPAENINIDYFGLALLDLQPYFESLGVGATGQIELNRTSIGKTEIIVPDRRIQDHFLSLVRPMRVLAENLLRKNAILASTRDLLLPRLISGEIDVSNLGNATLADQT